MGLDRGNQDKLLSVLMNYAPDGEAQEVCADKVRLAESIGVNGRGVEKMLILMLADGVVFGNWPWSTSLSTYSDPG